MKNQIESRIQQECVKYFRYKYPQIIISSFPNQGIRSKANASRMKAEGLTAGLTDLIIFTTRIEHNFQTICEIYGALLIEFKTEKGVLSKVQKEVHEKLRKSGYKVEICRSFDEFKSVVESYLTT